MDPVGTFKLSTVYKDYIFITVNIEDYIVCFYLPFTANSKVLNNTS